MRVLSVVVATSLLGQAHAAGQREAQWREAIARKPVPRSGCFEAAYPLIVWKQVGCVTAPPRPYVPAARTGASHDTTGGGNDYAAATRKLTSSATGFFPVVQGLKSERGSNGHPNSYSLQLNSDFMANEPACSGAADPANCRGWQQFAYSGGFGVAFVQYWLIDYGATCPAGWSAFETSCFTNGPAISVPPMAIKQIKTMKLSGSAVKNGLDTLVLTTKRKAYSVTGQDSVLHLAELWKASEFNVFGDGGRSRAIFNAGTSLTVEIDVTDGTKHAPTCQADGGTSGETNNLNLGDCTAKRGKNPSITFVESLAGGQ